MLTISRSCLDTAGEHLGSGSRARKVRSDLNRRHAPPSGTDLPTINTYSIIEDRKASGTFQLIVITSVPGHRLLSFAFSSDPSTIHCFLQARRGVPQGVVSSRVRLSPNFVSRSSYLPN